MVASHCKSVAKAITWRVLGAADTFVLSFLVTGKATAACGIVGFELLTKSVLYYGHERAWEMQGRWQIFWPQIGHRHLPALVNPNIHSAGMGTDHCRT